MLNDKKVGDFAYFEDTHPDLPRRRIALFLEEPTEAFFGSFVRKSHGDLLNNVEVTVVLEGTPFDLSLIHVQLQKSAVSTRFVFQKFKFILHFIPWKNGTPGVAPPRHSLSDSNGFVGCPQQWKQNATQIWSPLAANLFGTRIPSWKASGLAALKNLQQQIWCRIEARSSSLGKTRRCDSRTEQRVLSRFSNSGMAESNTGRMLSWK